MAQSTCSVRRLLMLVGVATAVSLFIYWRHTTTRAAIPYERNEDPTGPVGILASHPNVPYEFKYEVDFRIIVMTFSRPKSLLKLLDSLNNLVVGSDSVALDIFIDRDKKHQVSKETVQAAIDFPWKLPGRKEVHVWEKHVGIYGQWIDSWRPRNNSHEITLILEDDLSVSPYAYQWLKATHKHYDHREDISGYSLQSENVNPVMGGGRLDVNADDVTYLYKLIGTWGFSPHPRHWRRFQDWFHKTITDDSFHPYVAGIKPTTWYKDFERKGTSDSMWEMWLIWYTDKHKLYCLYNNLNQHATAGFLSQNRKEDGLHFHGQAVATADKLLTWWQESYVNFPIKTKTLDYRGKVEKG